MKLRRVTLISHDADSTIEGYYITITANGTASAPKKLSFAWNPKTPNALHVSSGFNLER